MPVLAKPNVANTPRRSGAEETELPLEPLPVPNPGNAKIILELNVQETLQGRLSIHSLGQERNSLFRKADSSKSATIARVQLVSALCAGGSAACSAKRLTRAATGAGRNIGVPPGKTPP